MRRRAAPLWVAACALASCQARPPATAPVGAAPREGAALATPVPTPSTDGAGACADVGTLRACWDASGPPRLIARTVPGKPAASPMGWRCAWPGPVRLCVDRRAAAAPFACAGAVCTQRHARMPDDGEWTCVDAAGAVLCVGGERAAGVVAGPPDAAWICGERRGQGAGEGERQRRALGPRVCVDLSPDVPDGDMSRWRCRIESGPPAIRVCERAPDVPVLTVACDRAHPCVDGAMCVGARCVPAARPAPTCWLDSDCPGSACRFGTCRAEAIP